MPSPSQRTSSHSPLFVWSVMSTSLPFLALWLPCVAPGNCFHCHYSSFWNPFLHTCILLFLCSWNYFVDLSLSNSIISLRECWNSRYLVTKNITRSTEFDTLETLVRSQLVTGGKPYAEQPCVCIFIHTLALTWHRHTIHCKYSNNWIITGLLRNSNARII